jgi:choline dehydrogenase-like flavoprotein
MLTTNFAEAGGFIKSDPSEPVPDLQLHFVIGKLVDHGRKTVLGHGYSCHVCLLQPVEPGQRHPGQHRPFATPAVDPNFLAERDDVDRLVRGFKRMRAILNQPALAATVPARAAGVGHGTNRREIEAVHPPPRRHHLPPGGQLPHGRRAVGRGGCPTARARHVRACGWWMRPSCRAS